MTKKLEIIFTIGVLSVFIGFAPGISIQSSYYSVFDLLTIQVPISQVAYAFYFMAIGLSIICFIFNYVINKKALKDVMIAIGSMIVLFYILSGILFLCVATPFQGMAKLGLGSIFVGIINIILGAGSCAYVYDVYSKKIETVEEKDEYKPHINKDDTKTKEKENREETLQNIEIIKGYKDLLDKGIITQEEFDKKKSEILKL